MVQRSIGTFGPPDPKNYRIQDRCNVDIKMLVGATRRLSTVGNGENLRKRMVAERDSGFGRFVAELGPIAYLPGGRSSWRWNSW